MAGKNVCLRLLIKKMHDMVDSVKTQKGTDGGCKIKPFIDRVGAKQNTTGEGW